MYWPACYQAAFSPGMAGVITEAGIEAVNTVIMMETGAVTGAIIGKRGYRQNTHV